MSFGDTKVSGQMGVLLQLVQENNYYLLTGVCYGDGLMDGEGISLWGRDKVHTEVTNVLTSGEIS